MNQLYRLMVVGEDGLEFCFANNVHKEDVEMCLKQIEISYPEASAKVEMESNHVYTE